MAHGWQMVFTPRRNERNPCMKWALGWLAGFTAGYRVIAGMNRIATSSG
jgi:hypothetical protein